MQEAKTPWLRWGVALVVRVLLAGTASAGPARPSENWEAPRQLSFTPWPSELQYNWGWAVDVDGAGVVHVTWLDRVRDSGAGHVFYTRSGDDGASWLPPVPLSPGDAAPPKIAASGPHVWVAWHRPPAGPIVLRHSSDHGEHWDDPVGVTPTGAFPSIAAWANTVHVVWSAAHPLTQAPEIFLRSSKDAGESWTPIRSVSTSDGRSSWVPSVAPWGSTVHVVWSDERDNVDDLGRPADCRLDGVPCREEEYYRRSDDFGDSFGSEIRLTQDPPGKPQPSWAPSNAVWGPTVHVTFFDARTGSFQIYYKRSRANGERGSWEDERLLSAHGGPYLQRARPVIAVHADRVGVVYFAAGPTIVAPPSSVFFVGSPDGGSRFTSPLLLAPSGTHPSVAVSPSGATHVVFHAPDARGVSQIFHRRRR